jgi:hypothetical protein
MAVASAKASSCVGVAPASCRWYVAPAREILLDDVVLRRALEPLRVDPALLGERHVE